VILNGPDGVDEANSGSRSRNPQSVLDGAAKANQGCKEATKGRYFNRLCSGGLLLANFCGRFDNQRQIFQRNIDLGIGGVRVLRQSSVASQRPSNDRETSCPALVLPIYHHLDATCRPLD